jgi:hypothetical protein
MKLPLTVASEMGRGISYFTLKLVVGILDERHVLTSTPVQLLATMNLTLGQIPPLIYEHTNVLFCAVSSLLKASATADYIISSI